MFILETKNLQKNYGKGSGPQISMTSYANAYLEKEDEVTVYESWYA